MKPFHATRAQLPTSKGYSHVAHPVRDDGMARDACSGAIVRRIFACSCAGRAQTSMALLHVKTPIVKTSRSALPSSTRTSVERLVAWSLWEERGCGKRAAVGFAVPSRPSRGSLCEAPRVPRRDALAVLTSAPRDCVSPAERWHQLTVDNVVLAHDPASGVELVTKL